MTNKLRMLIDSSVRSCGVTLVDVELKGRAPRQLLRIKIDKDSGVTLEDCEQVSRQLSAVLDMENDLIQGAYTLEVTSPGVDRPLKTSDDFTRNIGKLLRIVTKTKVENRNFFLARLLSVDGESITVEEDKKAFSIPMASISKANMEIEIK